MTDTKRRPYRRYSDDVKREVLQEFKDNPNYKEILKKWDISSTSLIYNWRRQAEINLYRAKSRKMRTQPVIDLSTPDKSIGKTAQSKTVQTKSGQTKPKKGKRDWLLFFLLLLSLFFQGITAAFFLISMTFLKG